jgi:ferrous iron transport protein A
VKILDVNTGGGALKNLGRLGLNIHNVIEVKRKSFFGGPVLVEYRDTEIAVGNGLAGKIIVERV